jgi:hypothetical protein
VAYIHGLQNKGHNRMFKAKGEFVACEITCSNEIHGPDFSESEI